MKGHWVKKPSNGTIIVFLHGVLSDAEACWRHENGTYWPELLSTEAQLADFGIYVFSYKTGYFSGTYRLRDVVQAFEAHADADGVLQSRSIIFVCHSMGGIVARNIVVSHALSAKTTPEEFGLFLIASPSLGSAYANWIAPVARLFDHTQADALRSSPTNSWLLDLDRDFMNVLRAGRIRIEGKELVEDRAPVLGKQVVNQISAARYFENPYKVENSSHSSISKVPDRSAIQHRLLLKFLSDFESGFATHLNSASRESGEQQLVGVEDFSEVSLAGDAPTAIAKTIETFFIRHLHQAGFRVVSSSTTQQSKKPARSITGCVLRNANEVVFDFEVSDDGALSFKDSVVIDLKDLMAMLETFPTAFLSFVGLSPSTLSEARNVLPTSSFPAYCLFHESRRLAAMQQLSTATSRLEKALSLDPNFQSALWAKGDLLIRSGTEEDQKVGETLVNEAERKQPDLKKISLYHEQINPLPELARLAASLDWKKLDEGLELATIRSSTYGISIWAWKVDWRVHSVQVVEAIDPKGESVPNIRKANDALLALNGGPWDRDPDGRLTPSGFLAANGVQISERNAKGGTGLFAMAKHGPQIGYVDDLDTIDTNDGIQAGPILIEPDGTCGILTNDNNRVDRSAIGIMEDNSLLFVLVKGGLSLRELSKILAAEGADFGLRCRVALNLDGGPSTQASYWDNGKSSEIEGTWLVQSALVVHRRSDRNT